MVFLPHSVVGIDADPPDGALTACIRHRRGTLAAPWSYDQDLLAARTSDPSLLLHQSGRTRPEIERISMICLTDAFGTRREHIGARGNDSSRVVVGEGTTVRQGAAECADRVGPSIDRVVPGPMPTRSNESRPDRFAAREPVVAPDRFQGAARCHDQKR